ncbi:hypothetical protein BDQ17DRAFT_1217770, partial [Cyathus striatus]
MYWVFMAPELITAWANRQHWGAKRIYREYKPYYKHWTMVHAHFLQMGGFHVSINDHKGVVDPVAFRALLSQGKIQFPMMSKEEIQDKSKSSAFAKHLLGLQAIWFNLQCFARFDDGLPLTLLEVTTLALVMANVTTIGTWWHKPYDVQKPI